jgi:hypothetical protein
MINCDLAKKSFQSKRQKNYKEKKSLKLLRIDNNKQKFKKQIKKLWLSHNQWRLGANATYFIYNQKNI